MGRAHRVQSPVSLFLVLKRIIGRSGPRHRQRLDTTVLVDHVALEPRTLLAGFFEAFGCASATAEFVAKLRYGYKAHAETD